MADDSQTCCTVETPSRLLLFYPDSAPASLTSLLPTLPLCRPVGHQLVLGRSSSVDVRLNDERMSRVYAALWHDGKDPFVFRVSNLSERKLLTVDGVMLRYQEEAEVKEGSVVALDGLEFKAKVCAGDVVTFTYQVSFVKNVVMSPVSPKPPEGKCLMSPRRDGMDTSFTSSNWSLSGKVPMESIDRAATPLLSCLRSKSLDSQNAGVHSADPFFRMRSLSCYENVGIEYELPENIPTMSSGYLAENIPTMSHGYPSESDDSSLWSDQVTPALGSHTDIKPLNILPQPSPLTGKVLLPSIPAAISKPDPPLMKPQYASPACGQTPQTPSLTSPKRNGLSCWFNISTDAPVPQESDEDKAVNTSGSGQKVQNGMSIRKQICPNCHECEKSLARPTTLELKQGIRRQTPVLADMVPAPGNGRRSPVEDTEWNANSANIGPVENAEWDYDSPKMGPVESSEWDTDDPNINCYMN